MNKMTRKTCVTLHACNLSFSDLLLLGLLAWLTFVHIQHISQTCIPPLWVSLLPVYNRPESTNCENVVFHILNVEHGLGASRRELSHVTRLSTTLSFPDNQGDTF